MFLPPLYSAIICVIIFVKWLYKRGRFWECLESIPQPPGYPIIGNLLDFVHGPDQTFLNLRRRGLEYYPIFKLDLAGVPSANILSPEDIELVLTDTNQNTKSILYDLLHSWLGTGLLTSEGSKWQSRRKILTPAFHFNILQEFVSVFVEETKKLIEDLERNCGDPIDVIRPISHFTLMSIGETAMGIDLDSCNSDKKGYLEAIYELSQIMTYRALRPWFYKNFLFSFTSKWKSEKEVTETVHSFSKSVINERQNKFSADCYSSRKRLAMLDLLLKYKSEGANIDDEGIREEVDTFMFEGYDTTSMAICYTLMLLANHQAHQEDILKEIEEVLGDEPPAYGTLQELKVMERCIKESLRLYPSVPFISRTSGSEIQTKSGFIIPKDCMINIFIYDLHHNPNVFPDPERFDPDRFLPENIQGRHPFSYIPFSAGSRNCIGQKFAMLEIKTVLSGILKKFVLEPADSPEDIVLMNDIILRPKNGIKVKFVPRTAN